MIIAPTGARVHVALGITDMRKGMCGLSTMVQTVLAKDPSLAVTGRDDFKRKVRSSMRQLQNDPEKIRSFYQKPSLKYGA